MIKADVHILRTHEELLIGKGLFGRRTKAAFELMNAADVT